MRGGVWGGVAALTLQSEWVRWRGELMSLGVDDRSPSSAEASEMMEGWREWHGLTRTAATKTSEGGGDRGEKRLVFVLGCVWIAEAASGDRVISTIKTIKTKDLQLFQLICSC